MELSDAEQALILKLRAAQKGHGFTPRELSSIPDADKVAAFDRLFNMAMENYRHLEEHGCEEKDIEHWMYEEVMKLLGDQVFDGVNAYL
jgi:hypothetical protein